MRPERHRCHRRAADVLVREKANGLAGCSDLAHPVTAPVNLFPGLSPLRPKIGRVKMWRGAPQDSAHLLPPLSPGGASLAGPSISVHSRHGLHTRRVTLCDPPHRHFSMTTPIDSGWSCRRVGLSPTETRRLWTGHTRCGPSSSRQASRSKFSPPAETIESSAYVLSLLGVPICSD
jgi:hypothetical protein